MQNFKIAIPILIKALMHRREKVRDVAKYALKRIDPKWAKSNIAKQSISKLADQLESHNRSKQLAAALALEEVGTNAKQSIYKIVKTLKNGNKEIKLVILRILNKINDQQTIPNILGLLSSNDKDIRKEAIWVLSNMKAKHIIPDLLKHITDECESVRKTTLEALVKIDPYWATSILTVQAIPELMLSLENPSKDIKAWTAYILGRIGPNANKAVPLLIDNLNTSERYVKREIIWALGQIGEKSHPAIPKLVLALKDDSEIIRNYAINSLKEIDPKWNTRKVIREAVPELTHSLLESKDIFVKIAAAKTLTKIAAYAEMAVPALKQALKTDSIALLTNVIEALGEIGEASRTSIPKLLKILKLGDWNIYKTVINALVKIGQAAETDLIKALINKDNIVRSVAKEALDRIDPLWHQKSEVQKAIPALTKALAHLSFDIRKAAIGILEKMGPKAKVTVPHILRALKDEYIEIRLIAAKTLGRMGPDIIEFEREIVKSLTHQDRLVKKEIKRSLDYINPLWRKRWRKRKKKDKDIHNSPH